MSIGHTWRMPRSSNSGSTAARRHGVPPVGACVMGAMGACVMLLLVWRVLQTSSGSSGSSSSSSIGAAGQPHYASAYEAEAARNLTRFRNSLLSEIIPTLSTRVNGTVGMHLGDWDLFSPAISCPPGRPLKRYGKGEGDGTKLLCAMEALPQPCVIYSMGSAGNYLFEEAMLAATSCHIHTFDCTFEGKSIDPARHTYHKWCIGNPGMALTTGLDFKSWDAVTKALGHSRVHLLKIDIEGHEYPVLAELQAGSGRVLPDEVSIEIHARMVAGWAKTHLEGAWQNGLHLPHTPGDLALVFMHLANQGYGVYSSEPNQDWSMCCSEFSLLRVPGAAWRT